MLSSMAVDAQGDEVLCRVVSQPAARFPVMDLQVSERPAQLRSPPVSLQDLFAKSSIVFRVDSATGFTLAQYAHSVSRDSPPPEQLLFWQCSIHLLLALQGILPIVLLQTGSGQKIGTQIISRQ